MVTAVPLHIDALQDSDVAIRKKAATSLWLIGPEASQATPALLLALHDPDDGVRQAAARALGRCSPGTPAALAGLVTALKDKHAEVRAAAAGAFAEMWVAEKSSGERVILPSRARSVSEGPEDSSFTLRARGRA